MILFAALLLISSTVSSVRAEEPFQRSYFGSHEAVTGMQLDTIPIVSIKAAKELPIGTQFITEGIVTRTLGKYTRIQDQTGGITIIQESGLFYNQVQTSDIAMGDRVRIEGRVSENNFLKVISTSDLINHSRISRLNPLPIPAKITLAEIANNGAAYESCLIRVENLTITSDNDLTYNESKTYQVMDSSEKTNSVVIRIGTNPDTDMDGKVLYTSSVIYEGVLSQSSSAALCGYQLMPVLQTDLRTLFSDVSETGVSNKSSLSNNYPNPFNASTTIEYNLLKTDYVSLKVLDILGNVVATLADTFQKPGIHRVLFTPAQDASSIGSSVYFYRLAVGTFVTSKQMIFLK